MKTASSRHGGSFGYWALLPALMLVASAAQGQSTTTATSGESEQLQEIIVTAQKRSEDVQNVPIAITAISGETLQQRGATSLSQLSNIAPNVNLDAGTPFSGSDTVLSAYIRGIGQDDFAFNLDPGVGVYVDGVYLARSVGANTSMLDVDRVEILKGPQGTLFGRNSIGGAISIVTRDPGNEFSAKGEVTTGSFDRFDSKLSFDVPLISDILLSTISFSSQSQEGYQHAIPYVQHNVGGSAGIPDCTTPICPYLAMAALVSGARAPRSSCMRPTTSGSRSPVIISTSTRRHRPIPHSPSTPRSSPPPVCRGSPMPACSASRRHSVCCAHRRAVA